MPALVEENEDQRPFTRFFPVRVTHTLIYINRMRLHTLAP